jgi:hypothetical protein
LSIVNLPHEIDFMALCGTNLVTLSPRIEGNETFVVLPVATSFFLKHGTLIIVQ